MLGCCALLRIVHYVFFFQLANSVLIGTEQRFQEYGENDFSKASEEESDLINHGSFGLRLQTQNSEDGSVIIPWITHMGLLHTTTPPFPVCYNQAQKDFVVRLAYVICRQAGFMIATRWFGVQKETIGLNANSTGLSGYCRGDEQLVTHCQWKLPNNPTLCSYLLAIQCGDCSQSFLMAEESKIILASPGFPIYIPLVVCEWNITLLPENNLLIRFQQFELPSPVYDESVNAVSCRSGSLDVMSWHEDINKMALDGRFCGRYSPGNLTIFSNRILIRFTAGSLKVDAANRKGLRAECSIVPLVQLSGNIVIVRWVLVGCAVLFTAVIALFFFVWKGSLHSLHQSFCWSCWTTSLPVGEGHPTLMTSPLSTVLPSSVTTFSRISAPEEQRIESIYHRRPSELKAPVQNCDSRHLEQTRRLEKWHSAHHTSQPPAASLISMQSISDLKRELSVASTAKEKDESHVYEEIDIALQNEKQKTCCANLPCHHTVSIMAPPRIMSFVNRNHQYEPLQIISYYQQTPLSGPVPTSSLAAESQFSDVGYVQQSLHHVSPCSHCSGSLSSTPFYFPQSSDSGDSASISGIYICPEPDSEE